MARFYFTAATEFTGVVGDDLMLWLSDEVPGSATRGPGMTVSEPNFIPAKGEMLQSLAKGQK